MATRAKSRRPRAVGPNKTPAREHIVLAAWPGLDIAALTVADGVALGRPRAHRATELRLDTADLRLARAGIEVRPGNERWTVTLGDLGQAEFPVAEGAADDDPPEALVAALRAVSRNGELAVRPVLRRFGRIYPLVEVEPEPAGNGGAGPAEPMPKRDAEPVGSIIDEDVSMLDGRRVISRQRFVEVDAPPDVVGAVRTRVAALGLQNRLVSRPDFGSQLGPPDPVPAPLGAHPTGGVVIQRALARSVARWLRHDPVVRLDVHVEGVHQMRVATRRLRSDLRTFGSLLGELPDGLIDELRWIAGLLGEVRDPDVLREGLIESASRLSVDDRRSTTSIVRRLARQRDGALDRLHAALDSERYFRLVQQVVALAQSPPLKEEARRSATSALTPLAMRAWRRLRRAARQAEREGAPVEDVHAMRIAAKRFRYALDLLSDVEPNAAELAARLAELQDVLGVLNDKAVAEEWLRGVAERDDDPHRSFVLGQLVMWQHLALEDELRKWPKRWRELSKRRRVGWLTG
jgi:CHAD domain-containing protein